MSTKNKIPFISIETYEKIQVVFLLSKIFIRFLGQLRLDINVECLGAVRKWFLESKLIMEKNKKDFSKKKSFDKNSRSS